MSGLHEFCGVAAAAMFSGAQGAGEQQKPEGGPSRPAQLAAQGAGEQTSVVQVLYEMLLDLQHRGQLSAGITTYSRHRSRLLQTHKALGNVGQSLGSAEGLSTLRQMDGVCGIGHVRYATCGPDDINYAQPIERLHGRRWKWFAICFNGQIANFQELKKQLSEEQSYQLINENSDTEALMHYIAYGLRGDRVRPIEEVFAELAPQLDGAYSIAIINAEGEVAVVRDPFGFRPMCYGTNGRIWAAASESIALSNLGITDIKALEPGTMAIMRNGRLEVKRFAESKRKGFCYFEWVYFASAASVLDGRSVYMARKELGRELARYETVPADAGSIVVPVPDCAKAAADSMAYELGIPCVEGLLRNRYVGRTFIEGRGREEKARKKYAPLAEILSGKRVFLVEDSIVRLTTLRAVLQQMRERGGAREIHVRVTCPPVVGPCFYGIDMSTVSELYAYKFIPHPIGGRLPPELLAKMAADIGADSLFYMPIESVPRCIGLSRDELCMACVDTKYLTPWGHRLYEEAVKVAAGAQPALRTYEAVR